MIKSNDVLLLLGSKLEGSYYYASTSTANFKCRRVEPVIPAAASNTGWKKITLLMDPLLVVTKHLILDTFCHLWIGSGPGLVSELLELKTKHTVSHGSETSK